MSPTNKRPSGTRKSDPFSRQLRPNLRNTTMALSRTTRSPRKARWIRPRLQPISGGVTLIAARAKDQKTGALCRNFRCQNLADCRVYRQLHADLHSQRQTAKLRSATPRFTRTFSAALRAGRLSPVRATASGGTSAGDRHVGQAFVVRFTLEPHFPVHHTAAQQR